MSTDGPSPDDIATAYEQARALAAIVRSARAEPVVAEAELALRGLYPVTVTHGTPETGTETQQVHEILPDLARNTRCLIGSLNGPEHTTFLFGGPGADAVAEAFAQSVSAFASRWWTVTRSL